MAKLKILLIAVVTMAMTIGLAGMASAANIGCGQCHGTYDNGTNAGTSNKTDRRGVSEPGYESSTMPTQDNGSRGLHGIHMNYSSATYGANGTQTVNSVVYSKRGNCNYCHNNHNNHATGKVNFTYPGNRLAPVATQPLLNNISGLAGRMLMTYTSAGRGTSYGNNIPSFDLNPTGNCTTACHRGTSGARPAPWANYTATSIQAKLDCASCHMDSSNIGTISTTDGITVIGAIPGYTLSSPPHVQTAYEAASLKGHAVHLNGDWADAKMKFGSYTGSLKSGNYACQLCHTDNRGEGGKPSIRNADGTLTIATNDFGSYDLATGKMFKAYPHASNGTEVDPLKASIGGLAGVALNDPVYVWNATTAANGKFGCTSACHANSNGTTYGGTIGNLTWDDTGKSHCESCHNHTATSAVNNASAVTLTYGHSLHFDQIQIMMGRAASCNDCHVGTHANNYAGKPGITQLPVLPGSAGLLASMNWSAAGTLSVSGTCSGNNCHSSASPAWNSIATGSVTPTAGCSTCHSYPGATLAQGDWAANSNNGHVIRYMTTGKKGAPLSGYTTTTNTATYNTNINVTHLNQATAYNAATDTYAGVTGDANLCGKCHSGGSHMNGVKNVNAGTGNASGFSLVTSYIGGQGHVAQCTNAKCHFNRKTPNWY